jgi:hypothetical protein
MLFVERITVMYKYRFTIEALSGATSADSSDERVMRFEIENHDDLFKITEAVCAKELLDADKSAALAIGLKLFSEVVLEKRHDPLFAPLSEPIRHLIQQLKGLPIKAGVVDQSVKNTD